MSNTLPSYKHYFVVFANLLQEYCLRVQWILWTKPLKNKKKMVEKDPQIRALDAGELDIFIDSMEPWKVESIGNQS